MASLNGTVKFFNETKGFGFITPDGGGKDVFVHATAVERAGMKPLREGQRVMFDTESDARGPKAVNLRSAEVHCSPSWGRRPDNVPAPPLFFQDWLIFRRGSTERRQ